MRSELGLMPVPEPLHEAYPRTGGQGKDHQGRVARLTRLGTSLLGGEGAGRRSEEE